MPFGCSRSVCLHSLCAARPTRRVRQKRQPCVDQANESSAITTSQFGNKAGAWLERFTLIFGLGITLVEAGRIGGQPGLYNESFFFKIWGWGVGVCFYMFWGHGHDGTLKKKLSSET